MSRCDVQVIMPVYNSEKTIEKCLDSLKNQTFPYWQAILIDDASTDKSVEIIQKYIDSDDRFILVRNEENQGVARTRNRGLGMLTAKYTAFLDSDDYWEDNMLAVMCNKAAEYNCDVLQCRFIYDFENGKQVLPSAAFKKETFLTGKKLKKIYIKMMTGINMNHVCIKLMKTKLLKGLEFETGLKTAEDLIFCIQMFKKVESYVFVPEVLYHYYRSGTSLTGSSLTGKQKLEANRYAANAIIDALSYWNMDKPYYKLLAKMRVYIIIVSKIFRTLREKIIAGRGEKCD